MNSDTGAYVEYNRHHSIKASQMQYPNSHLELAQHSQNWNHPPSSTNHTESRYHHSAYGYAQQLRNPSFAPMQPSREHNEHSAYGYAQQPGNPSFAIMQPSREHNDHSAYGYAQQPGNPSFAIMQPRRENNEYRGYGYTK